MYGITATASRFNQRQCTLAVISKNSMHFMVQKIAVRKYLILKPFKQNVYRLQTIERSVCGSDAAFCHITLTTCLLRSQCVCMFALCYAVEEFVKRQFTVTWTGYCRWTKGQQSVHFVSFLSPVFSCFVTTENFPPHSAVWTLYCFTVWTVGLFTLLVVLVQTCVCIWQKLQHLNFCNIQHCLI